MTFRKVPKIRKVCKRCLVALYGVFARRRTDDALAAIAAAGLTAEVARIMAAVRNKLADMDVRLEDMSADIIIFVSKYVRQRTTR